MSVDNLKPCPFCGAEAIFGGSDNVNGHPYWYVYCRECGATVNGNEDADKAIEAWNRRADNG